MAVACVQAVDEVGSQLGLAGLGVGVGGREVVLRAAQGPGIGVAQLGEHDGLGRETALERVELLAQGRDGAVIGRVVAEPYDVVVDTSGLGLAVEVGGVVHLAQLGVDDDLGLRAHLAHGAAACLEIACQVVPRPAVDALARGPAVPRGPQHAIGDLVAHLHIVGSGAGSRQGLQRGHGVGIYRVGNLCGRADAAPAAGHGLLARVGPGVAVVEVEHQLHAGFLDAPPQCFNIGQVLHHALLPVGCRGLRRVDKEAHAHGVPACALVVGYHVAHQPGAAVVLGPGCLVAGQHRDVAAHESHVVAAAPQDGVDQRGHVGHVHLAVAVEVAGGVVAVAGGVQHLVGQGGHVGHVHHAVAVDVASGARVGAAGCNREQDRKGRHVLEFCHDESGKYMRVCARDLSCRPVSR